MIRPAEPADAVAVAAILAQEIASGVAHFGTAAPTAEDLAEEIAGTGAYPFLVVDVDGQVAGFARATPWKPRGGYAWTVEVGVYLAPGHQGRGYGRKLVGTLLEELEAGGFRTVLAGIALPNPGSVGLFEALGFRSVGVFEAIGFKHGAWHDVGYWSLRLGGAA